ncbi:tegument UL14 [Colobine gammaherpesvirus 1]|uniref:Tegument UL14 n=1 Tax=Colobine gammaherpesvirus 1 TaxID=2597325 RepID=A0A5B8FKM4_9GAMA|nr:tegument UL14 [Colobine gammaherpesvirus 1]QDQ69243.1 tegument UL14 [Colobine gammaherpesvirus 1]
MTCINSKRDFIKSALVAEVQRKTTVSVFDRFGSGSAIFEKQFLDAQEAGRVHEALQRETRILDLAREVRDKVEATKRERSALGNPKNLPSADQIDALRDHVAELKEQVLARVDALEEYGGDRPGDTTEEVQDTVLNWRLGRLPPVYHGAPQS